MTAPKITIIRLREADEGFYLNAGDLLNWLDGLQGNKAQMTAKNYIIERIVEMFYGTPIPEDVVAPDEDPRG